MVVSVFTWIGSIIENSYRFYYTTVMQGLNFRAYDKTCVATSYTENFGFWKPHLSSQMKRIGWNSIIT